MAEVQTITLADIRANPTLMEANIEPGDTYTVGQDDKLNIQRVHSKEGGMDLGVVVTEEVLKNQPELVEIGVEVGDRYLEDQDKFIKTGSGSAWEQYWYHFDETPGMLQNVGDILESWAPIGTFDLFTNDSVFGHKSPEESYGEGFGEADNKTQRQMILRARERKLLKDSDRMFTPDPDSLAAMAGKVTGGIADLTTLIPFVGPAAKGAALGAKALRYAANVGIGGGLGAGYSVTEDLAAGEDVDVTKALQTGALAAGGTGALLGLGKGISKLRERPVVLKDAMADETVSRFYNKTLDEYLGATATRMGTKSEPLLMRTRKYEFNTKINTNKYLDEAAPFIKSLSKMKGPVKNSLARHLSNQNFSAAENLMTKYGPPEMVAEFKPVVSRLKEVHKDLEFATGEKIGYVEKYFPRVLKKEGYDNLQKLWGKEKGNNLLSKALKEEASKKGFATVDHIPQYRKYEIANRLAQGFTTTGKSIANKNRKVDVVTEDMLPNYETPEKALQLYLRNSVNTIERGKYFGKHAKGKGYGGLNLKTTVKDVDGSIREMDVDESIGELIEKYASDLSNKDQIELMSLVQSRFKGGERSPRWLSGAVRDLGYMGTIANPVSAVTQLGDVANPAALKGFRNTIGAMFGTKDIKMINIGLVDSAEEFADQTLTANALRKLFKYSGFKAIDRLGKETAMTATYRKNIGLVKTPRGEKEFIDKWGKFYGDDIKKLVDDLKRGEITELVDFHAFNELSDIQPISLLENPQMYLDHPDSRILYALKTFTLKQYDIVRKNVVQEYAKGNKAKAIKQAFLIASYMMAANVGTGAIKDFLQGKDPELDDVIPSKSIWALLGVFGFNKYGIERYFLGGKPSEWGINTLMPATPIIDAVLGLSIDTAIKEDPNYEKYMRAVPLVGPLLYNWFGGGAKKYNERVEKERRER